MLNLNDITVRLGGRVILDRATASLPPGSRVGLIGRNGAGKTTLLERLLASGAGGSEGDGVGPAGTQGSGVRSGDSRIVGRGTGEPATVTIDDLELGAGFGSEEVSGLEKTYLNGGIGYYGLDPVYASLTAGRVLRTQGYGGVGEPWNLVLSASLDLAEGLTLAGDVAYFDNDLVPEAHELTGGDDGLVWVTRLEVAF